MARSSRMFEIIQLLRVATQPRTAHSIADDLEVTKRTIYRDIASLQAMRVPIEGAAGIGYIMRAGFELPPINFDVEEAEAITVGLLMIARTGDAGLEHAARRAARKLSDIRNAIRQTRKIKISYWNEAGSNSHRTILPLAIIYYAQSIVLAAWCELRGGFRHFRADRISSHTVLSEKFSEQSPALHQNWAQTHVTNL